MPAERNAPPGFTLIELAVVIAVVALVIGGIIVGQSLIHAAKLRAVVGDIQTLGSAVIAFQEKYKAKPGDMSNAVDYWGDAGGGCDNTASRETKNGNGNGNISVTTPYEAYTVWQHLSNAGFIAGTYGCASGIGGLSGVILGFNAPKTAIEGLALTFATHFDQVVTSDTGILFPGVYKDYMEVGGVNEWQDGVVPWLSAPDAFAIDSKTDDGKPAYGNIMSKKSVLYDSEGDPYYCSTTTLASTAEYETSVTDRRCLLIVHVFSI